MLDLHDREWKEFYLRDIFPDIQRGKRLKTADHIQGSIPYVSSSAINNGVDAFIGNGGKVRKFEECLTLANSGSVGKTFYHSYEFIASDHVTSLKSDKLNKYSYLFIATIVQRLEEKYSFNREINDVRINKEKIVLPVDESGNPDYAFMEQYIKEREQQIVQNYIDYIGKNIQTGGVLPALNEKEWKSFLISDIFDIFPGKRLVAADTTAGDRPFIGALDNNNGVARFVSDTNESLDKNVLGVNYNGNGMVIGFYHPYECIFSDDVKRFHLKHHEDNEFVLLFMKVAILQQKSKFGYLYKFNSERMANTGVMLPVDESGNPDYTFMEQYVKRVKETIELQYLQGKMAVIV